MSIAAGMIQIYWLPCPRCGQSSPVDTNPRGEVGIDCTRHGMTLIERRAPTEAESGKNGARGVYVVPRRRRMFSDEDKK